MQDKLIEAVAQEVEGPFIVEPEGRGCDKCGAGELWNVVFKPEDVALSTAYGDKEEAEDLANDLNNAFRKGVSSVRAHDAGTPQKRGPKQLFQRPSPTHESAPVAQLDAEDPAEPVEDVPPGYVSLNEVEKAIDDEWMSVLEGHVTLPAFINRLRAHLAPKPSPKVPYADCDAVDQWYVVDEKGEQIEIRFTNKRDAERYATGLRAELAALAADRRTK